MRIIFAEWGVSLSRVTRESSREINLIPEYLIHILIISHQPTFTNVFNFEI